MNYLIAGLGNIGAKYHGTRHNIGFEVADYMVHEAGEKFIVERLASLATIKYKGQKIYLIKPSTYMNLSGRAVKFWLAELKVPTENLMVVVDDIALDFGTIRIKKNGSEAGHNGLLNITEHLGHQNYARLRFGVGNDFPKGHQVDYVLGNWTTEQQRGLPERLQKMSEAIKSFSFVGIDRTMNLYNGQ